MNLLEILLSTGAQSFSGVPDSVLAPLSDALVDQYGQDGLHLVAANEGNAVAFAAGQHLATGKIPIVYMQNSGIGNAVNPVASLLNPKIYGIPCIFVIGWRGVPGVADEPQHVFQGEITLKLLELLDISYFVIDKGTSAESVKAKLLEWKPLLDSGNSVAFVIKKGALSSVVDPEYSNGYSLNREAVIERILSTSGSDPVISTTGKISRELYEIRERNQQGHKRDFLTVGSMGHASSIALGIASSLPDTKIWCLDGDGAALMHMGALAVIGARAPKNMVHIVLNNAAHESVGGVPTIADRISLCDAAFACGYGHVFSCETQDQLDVALESATSGNALAFIEVKCALGSRKDLGRPKTTPIENKKEFMEHLQS